MATIHLWQPLAAGSGREIAGPVVTYGEVGVAAGIGRLRFLAGSVEVADGARLNLQHDRAAVLALPTWERTDTALRLAATLPDGARQDQALADVAAGLLSGLSGEVEIIESELQAGVRVVRLGRLTGAAVVDTPALPGSLIGLQEGASPRRRRPFL